MVYVKPFRGIRPKSELAEKVSALPYDVMNRQEAKEMAENNDISILRITRAEIDFPDEVGDHDNIVYEQGKNNLKSFLEKGILFREDQPVYYIYREIMNENVQTGIVAAVAVSDYENGRVMKHELTRKEKEADRIRHFDVCDCQTEPVFFTYRHQAELDELIADWTQNHASVYDFVSEDGIQHLLWVVDEEETIRRYEALFAAMDKLYIADGHHRTASAAAIRDLRREQAELNPEDPANYIMAVIFPDDELNIMAYNRIVKIPEGFSADDFLEYLSRNFTLEKEGEDFIPPEKHCFGMYLNQCWYSLKANAALYGNENVSDNLDAAILQKTVFSPYFGIENPRTDHRIDFIGGIRGNEEIVRRCKEEHYIGFNLYPVDIADLMAVADAGEMMPPKSTWFEPKLRSGLFLHSFKRD